MKHYEKPCMIPLELISTLELSSSLLTGSLGQNEVIVSVGQEVGETYDFNATDNTFNQEWESGNLN